MVVLRELCCNDLFGTTSFRLDVPWVSCPQLYRSQERMSGRKTTKIPASSRPEMANSTETIHRASRLVLVVRVVVQPTIRTNSDPLITRHAIYIMFQWTDSDCSRSLSEIEDPAIGWQYETTSSSPAFSTQRFQRILVATTVLRLQASMHGVKAEEIYSWISVDIFYFGVLGGNEDHRIDHSLLSPHYLHPCFHCRPVDVASDSRCKRYS